MAERGVIFKDDFVSTPGKSWFDMSFDYLFSMNFGELVPSTCMECMGGDVIHAKSDSFVRLAPLVAPTFGKANMFSYHFYVRNRSIWKSWDSFFAEGDQRESWQQSIQGNFVPPEMPYIKPLKMLDLFCNSQFAVNGPNFNFANMINQFEIRASNAGYLSLEGAHGVRLLVISKADGGKINIYNSATDPLGVECVFDYEYDTDKNAEQIVIAYMPNKYDQFERSYLLNNQSKDVYNIFSNGTLFDYLGVDLSGHYAKQYDWVRKVVSDSRSALSDSGATIVLPDDGEVVVGSASINLKDFLGRYFVVAAGYCHNDQLVSCIAYSGLYSLGEGFTQTHASDVAALDGNRLYTHDSKIATLPLRAYHSIYIDYFRDENYINVNPCVDFSRDGEDYPIVSGSSFKPSVTFNELFDYLTLSHKAYEHDPYTTALPQAQRGPSVRFLNDSMLKLDRSKTASISASDYRNSGSSIAVSDKGVSISVNTTPTQGVVTGNPILVDLSAATIENFRFANATQKLLEKIARTGNRYYEYMKAVYGVVIDDAKIDRPIYLGGDKSPIQISEVLQTSASEVTTDQPLGQMAGRGVSVGNDDYIEYITPDNGFFIEICCALPRTNYQQGLAPYFHRFDRLDFAIPDYAQLGEQQVPQRELWYSANESDDETPFGYQSRYYDYKYLRDRTSGSFKDSLAFWTWSRIFDQAPIAGKEFIEVRPDYRQFAVTDKNVEHIYVHMWHDIQVNRCLPVFGTPSL